MLIWGGVSFDSKSVQSRIGIRNIGEAVCYDQANNRYPLIMQIIHENMIMTFIIYYTPTMNGELPKPRNGHQFIKVEDKLWLVGGTQTWMSGSICLSNGQLHKIMQL